MGAAFWVACFAYLSVLGAMNARFLSASVVLAIGLLAVYPDPAAAMGLCVWSLVPFLVSAFRD